MPFKHNLAYQDKFESAKYRVTNWPAYNKALQERGNITLWFDKRVIHQWYAKRNGKPDGQRVYSNTTIEIGNIFRLIFHLPYRQTVGFLSSIMKLMGLELRVPNFSTFSRRLKKLVVRLRIPNRRQGLHIIVDTSGLSVYGADEFRTIEKRLVKVRGYRKLNIAINEHQEIIACELTTSHANEKAQIPALLRQTKDHCEKFIADGNYDDKQVYVAIDKYRPSKYIYRPKHDNFKTIIPPRKDAKVRKRKRKYPVERSEHIQMIRQHGRINWQKATGYGERSLVEVAFYRYKRILGKFMHSTAFANQRVEAKLACRVLNIMTGCGMPQTQRIN